MTETAIILFKNRTALFANPVQQIATNIAHTGFTVCLNETTAFGSVCQRLFYRWDSISRVITLKSWILLLGDPELTINGIPVEFTDIRLNNHYIKPFLTALHLSDRIRQELLKRTANRKTRREG